MLKYFFLDFLHIKKKVGRLGFVSTKKGKRIILVIIFYVSSIFFNKKRYK